MKAIKWLLAGSLIFTCTSLFAEGGAGGFAGSTVDYTKYGHLRYGVGVYFQEDSRFVNPVYNKSLCLNADDKYEAIPLGGRAPKAVIFQNRVSLKEECVDSRCKEVEWVPWVQERAQWAEFASSSRGNGPYKKVKVIIPDCIP